MNYNVQGHITDKTFRVILVDNGKIKESVTDFIFSNKQEAFEYIERIIGENNDDTGATKKD